MPCLVRVAARSTLKLVLLLGVSLSFGWHTYGARYKREADFAFETNRIMLDKLIMFQNVTIGLDGPRGLDPSDDSSVDYQNVRERTQEILEVADTADFSKKMRS